MRMFRFLGLVSVLLISCLCFAGDEDVLFQVSTIGALLQGCYDGEVTFAELARHGDFGLGTFNAVDGEMIAVDGDYYRVRADGQVAAVSDACKTPFAAVTFFESDKTITLDREVDYQGLQDYIDGQLATENIFYAIRIEGFFKYIKARSIPAQQKPYPPLVSVVENQSAFFEFHNVEGILAGFRCPGYVKEINVPGYHLHFITEDRKAGGHLLECLTGKVKIDIDYTAKLFLHLPASREFYLMDLNSQKKGALEKVER